MWHVVALKGLIYKNLQNAAEGVWHLDHPGLAEMYRHPNCYTPLGRIYRVFAGFYWQLLLNSI